MGCRKWNRWQWLVPNDDNGCLTPPFRQITFSECRKMREIKNEIDTDPGRLCSHASSFEFIGQTAYIWRRSSSASVLTVRRTCNASMSVCLASPHEIDNKMKFIWHSIFVQAATMATITVAFVRKPRVHSTLFVYCCRFVGETFSFFVCSSQYKWHCVAVDGDECSATVGMWKTNLRR